jgi:hypothetical protein
MLAMLFLVLFTTLALGFYVSVSMSVQVSHNDVQGTRAMAAAESGMTFCRYHLEAMNLPYGTRVAAGATPGNLIDNVAASLGYLMNGSTNMGPPANTVRVTAGTRQIHLPSETGWVALDGGGTTRFRAVVEQPDPEKWDLVVTVYGAASATGAAGVPRTVRAIRMTYDRAPGRYALVGIQGVTMGGSSYTDSFDSSKGAYAAATARQNGSVASNGDIALSGSARVNGDARPGVGRSTTVLDTAAVTGRRVPLAAPLSYPSVTLPSGLTSLGHVEHTGGTYSQPGGTYVLESLKLSGNTVINWQGPVVLYIKGEYLVKDNVVINTYQNKPANRVLYFLPTCTTATWTGNNACVGELYAPDTEFLVSGSVQKFGRITAKRITNSSSGGMHADEALLGAGGSGGYVPRHSSYAEVRVSGVN